MSDEILMKKILQILLKIVNWLHDDAKQTALHVISIFEK